EYYQQAKESLRKDALAGRTPAQDYDVAALPSATPTLKEFWESGDAERFLLAGSSGNRLDYLVREPTGIRRYSRDLNLRMEDLSAQYARERQLVEQSKGRDLRRGLTVTLVVLTSIIWLLSFLFLIYIARRISQPIQDLTAGLSRLASGNLDVRLKTNIRDE